VAIRSNTKSIDQTALAAPGRISGSRAAARSSCVTATDLQALQRMQSPDALVVDPLPHLAQLQINHRGAVAGVPLHRHDLLTHAS
jgi:hypothetical protein